MCSALSWSLIGWRRRSFFECISLPKKTQYSLFLLICYSSDRVWLMHIYKTLRFWNIPCTVKISFPLGQTTKIHNGPGKILDGWQPYAGGASFQTSWSHSSYREWSPCLWQLLNWIQLFLLRQFLEYLESANLSQREAVTQNCHEYSVRHQFTMKIAF